MIPRFIEKYLNKFETKHTKVYLPRNGNYRAVVVIPCIEEFDNVPILLDSLLEQNKDLLEKTLFLFAVNNAESSPEQIKEDNRKLIKFLQSLIDYKDYPLNIACLDASSEGNALPDKEAGVGLARKTGVDASLRLLDYSENSKNIIIYLDADCKVSPNYLEVIYDYFSNKKIDAGSVYFEHDIPGNIRTAEGIILYEIFLRYLVLGLRYAGSHFAFHTVGSTICLTPETYVKAGGMNKKPAGEDFYFLEKIAKFTEITGIKGAAVYPSARESYRVPFGTGKSMTEFPKSREKFYDSYNPAVFTILKNWLTLFNSVTREVHPGGIIREAEDIDPVIKKFLDDYNFTGDWQKVLSNTKNNVQLNKQKIFWFDGLKTLRLLHYLRDSKYPNVNLFEAVNNILEAAGFDKIKLPDTDSVNEMLFFLRELRKIV